MKNLNSIKKGQKYASFSKTGGFLVVLGRREPGLWSELEELLLVKAGDFN